MSLKLYYDLMSQPSRAVYILLKTCKIPFENCPVALRKAEQLTEKYGNEVSRFQKVPVIKDGDFTLTESIAILRYLAREKHISAPWYPEDSKAQARVDEYLEWQHNNIRAFCSLYFRLKWIEPLITGNQPNPKKVAEHEEKMINTLDDFQKLFLSGRPYVAGDQISAADIWAACEIEQPRVAGYDPEVGRPVLSQWLNNVRKTLGPNYEEAHAFLNKLAKSSNKGTK